MNAGRRITVIHGDTYLVIKDNIVAIRKTMFGCLIYLDVPGLKPIKLNSPFGRIRDIFLTDLDESEWGNPDKSERTKTREG